MRILHIAPEYGLYLWLLRQSNIEYFGADIDQYRYRHIENLHIADLTSLPFDQGSFDIIICSHVLEHIPDDGKAMLEMLRVLKPGGEALLLTPLALDGRSTDEDPTITDAKERDRRFGQWDHVRIYGKQDFLDRLAATGFTVKLFEPYRTHRKKAEELNLNPLEELPIALRQR